MAKRKVPPKKILKVPLEFPTLKINPIALGYTGAILRVAGLTVITILGKIGFALQTVELAQQLHFTYSLAPLGIISGLAETALWGIIGGYLFGMVYNRFA